MEIAKFLISNYDLGYKAISKMLDAAGFPENDIGKPTEKEFDFVGDTASEIGNVATDVIGGLDPGIW